MTTTTVHLIYNILYIIQKNKTQHFVNSEYFLSAVKMHSSVYVNLDKLTAEAVLNTEDKPSEGLLTTMCSGVLTLLQ